MTGNHTVMGRSGHATLAPWIAHRDVSYQSGWACAGRTACFAFADETHDGL